MVQLANQKVHTAATVLLKVGGKIIAAGTTATADERWEVIPIPTGFGSIMPAEHAIVGWSASLTIDKLLVRRATLVALGLASTGSSILSAVPVDIELYDSGSETDEKYKNIVTFLQCTLNERNISVSGNGAITERTTWSALNVKYPEPIKPYSFPSAQWEA